MSTKAIIPRFLLPRQTPLWQHPLRHASNKTPPPKPANLAKPEKFNPPSHGSKLRQPGGPKITNYGRPLSAPELTAQSKRHYPNSLPPPGTLSHWFLHSRAIHVWISLSTLSSLALYSIYTSYRTDEVFMLKYGEFLPNLSDIFWHPIAFWRGISEVVRLRGEERSAETKEKRARAVEDVRKRGEFRKAHGLETEGFGGWSFKGDKNEGEKVNGAGGKAVVGVDGETVAVEGGNAEEGAGRKKSRYNFLGIF